MKALPDAGRKFVMAKAIWLATVLVAAVLLFSLNWERAEAESSGPPSSVQAKNDVSAKEDAKSGFDVLKGRWRRPDGG